MMASPFYLDQNIALSYKISSRVRIGWLILGLGLGMAVGLRLFADTEVWGEIDTDSHWSLPGSPYIVSGDLIVKKNINLSIEAGVIVRFQHFDTWLPYDPSDSKDSLYATLTVYGSLTAVGKPDRHIKFINHKKNKKWYGLVFNEADALLSNLAFCEIINSRFGIVCINTAPSIHNSIFIQNDCGILCQNNALPKIYNNIFSKNNYGIYCTGASPFIYNNIIMYSRNNAIWADRLSVPDIAYNDLWRNRDGDFLGFPYEVGIVQNINNRGDSADVKYNVFVNPVFKYTVSETLAMLRDLRLPTPDDKIKERKLAQAIEHKRHPQISAKSEPRDLLSVAEEKIQMPPPDTVNKNTEEKRIILLAYELQRRQKVEKLFQKLSAAEKEMERAEWVQSDRIPDDQKFRLSRYSPLLDAGHPDQKFNDNDGSSNDLGIYGGPYLTIEEGD